MPWAPYCPRANRRSSRLANKSGPWWADRPSESNGAACDFGVQVGIERHIGAANRIFEIQRIRNSVGIKALGNQALLLWLEGFGRIERRSNANKQWPCVSR